MNEQSTKNATNNETIRQLLAAYDPRRRRSTLIQYYRMQGPQKYAAFVETLPDDVKKLAFEIQKGFKNQRPRTTTMRPGNMLKTMQARNQKVGQMQQRSANARATLWQLPRGYAAFSAGRVQATRVTVPGDGNCLFYSVAQAVAQRQRKRFLTGPDLKREAMQLRRKVQFVQCNKYVDFFRGFLKQGHCQEILKPTMYGGEPELIALAMITQTPILVFEPTPQPNVFTRHTPARVYGPTRNPPIFLVYTPGKGPNPELSAHYDLLTNVQIDPSARLTTTIDMVPARRRDIVRANRQNRMNGQNAQNGMNATYPKVIGGEQSSSWWDSLDSFSKVTDVVAGVLVMIACVTSTVRMGQ